MASGQIPTILFVKDGKVQDQVVGAVPKAQIQAKRPVSPDPAAAWPVITVGAAQLGPSRGKRAGPGRQAAPLPARAGPGAAAATFVFPELALTTFSALVDADQAEIESSSSGDARPETAAPLRRGGAARDRVLLG